MAKKKVSTGQEFKGVLEQDGKGIFWLKKGVTPPGRVLWPSVFKPAITFNGRELQKKGLEVTNNDREYKCTLLFAKSDPVLKSMEKAIEELAINGLFGGVRKNLKDFKSPVKDGDEKYQQDPIKNEHYKGKKYLELKRPAKLPDPPAVVDEVGQEMLSQSDFYPGCWAVARVDFKTYSNFGGGVTAYWSAVKKIADDDKIGFDQAERAKQDFETNAPDVSVKDGKVVY